MIELGDALKASEKMDARQIRSRGALHAAFLELLEHKSMDQISIREISVAAGIGHATFYRHYPTKEALLNDLAAEQIRRLVDIALPAVSSADTLEALQTLTKHIKVHQRLWTTLLTGGAASAVKEELLRIARDVASYASIPPKNKELPESLKVTLAVSSILETLSWWLRQEDPMHPETVADYLDRVLLF